MAIDRYGRAGSPLVIALHGAAVNRKTLIPLGRALEDRFEVWAPDLPGHGARRNECFSIEASLGLIAPVLEEAAPQRPVLAGDSLGGYLALAAAASFGERIAGVVAGGCTWSMTGLGGLLARASDVPPALIESLAGSARVERWFAALIARAGPHELANEILAAGLRPQARGESLRELRGFDVVATTRRIAAPVTFINGVFDWPTRAGEGQALRAARSGKLILARCGHGVSFFAPAAFGAAIVATGTGES